MANLSEIRTAIANAAARQSAHHAHHKGKAVAFRANQDGRFDLTFNDGAEHRGLEAERAAELAAEYLGLTYKAPTPAKRASIALGRGWSIALRRDEVFPHDPGQGAPAMVCGPFGASATYTCAANEGEAYADRKGFVEIPSSVMRKLHAAEDAVNEYIDNVTAWLASSAAR